jgi:hypothetical protein
MAPYCVHLVSQLFKEWSSRTSLEEMEQFQHPPERVVYVASLSWCDLSEAGPHGPVLFQIRLRSFFPKED